MGIVIMLPYIYREVSRCQKEKPVLHMIPFQHPIFTTERKFQLHLKIPFDDSILSTCVTFRFVFRIFRFICVLMKLKIPVRFSSEAQSVFASLVIASFTS